MRLRDVDLGDHDVYVRMRCDPVMMAELGGPQPREGIAAKVRSDVESMASGTAWVLMILPDERDDSDESDTATVAGSVALWSHPEHGKLISELGWMVLPEYQGRGLGKAAVRELIRLARDDGRWGILHAFPGVTNAPSNGICRALGFRQVGQESVAFSDRLLLTNHWVVDPRSWATDLPR